jgi:DNA polymerase-3 subunit gamma/tau
MDQFRNILVSLIAPQGHLLDMSEAELDEARQLAEGAGSDKIQFLLNFLIRQEEVLRFSSHPRLILETTMIRLCTLGDFLSFGDLLEKIDALEKRLTVPTTINAQSKIGNLSESGATWISDNPEKNNANGEEGTPSGQTWGDFLTFLSSKNKAVFNILKDWRLLKMTENSVEIGGCSQSFSSAYFDDPKRYKDLSDYCRDFFRRDIHMKIVHDNKKQQPTGPSPRKRNADLPPPVQDILDMFQGEISKGYPAEK